MPGPLRVVVGAAGWAGHVFPAFAVARELRRRGHRVLLESSERWRPVAAELDLEFAAEPEEVVFPGPAPPGSGLPTLAEAARAMTPRLREFQPDVSLHDLYSLIPALASEAAGARRATMMPHPYPEPAGSEPPFAWGLMPGRTPVGRRFWRSTRGLVETRGRRRGRTVLNQLRAEVGLGPMGDHNLMISEGLTIVATFPQLEYPRVWPAGFEVTGPPMFELEHDPVDLPPGDDPLILVAASTRQDLELDLIRVALEAFRTEPVRVVAATNQPGRPWRGQVAENAVVCDWVSYTQILPLAAAVVCRGGHGTLARSLAAGVPVLVCPVGGDMAENATRVAWYGAGVTLPRRLLGPATLRLAMRRLLDEPRFAERAGEIAAWAARNDAAVTIADLLERFATQPR